jgi:signal transduction histidine kinase
VNGEVEFTLSDNGKGLQGKKLSEGFGLTSMRNKIENAGGNIKFIYEEGEGFEIHFSLPINTNAKKIQFTSEEIRNMKEKE